MKAIIIIPTYNEVENIDPLFKSLKEVFKKVPSKWDMHILIVDDTSPDGTGDVVRKKMKQDKSIHLFVNDKKVGLGGAYMKGMQYAIDHLHADVLLEMDADLQHDPDLIPIFLQKIDEGADLVVGARYIPGGSIPKYWGLSRKILSKGGNLFIRVMMLDRNIHDWTTGFRALKPWVFLKVKNKITELKTYSFQISFMYFARREGAKIAEVPLKFRERHKGVSKLPGLEGTIKTFWFVIKVRIRDFFHSRFFKFGTVGFIGYLVNAISLEVFARLPLTTALASIFSNLPSLPLSQSAAWAAALAAELAIISNFTLNNLWTFKEVKITSPLMLIKKFLQFNLSSVGAIIIQFIFIGVAVGLFGDTRMTRQIALLVSMPVVLSFNYFMYNVFIWKTWKIPALSWLQKLVG